MKLILEPRYLFDGSIAAVVKPVADAAHDPSHVTNPLAPDAAHADSAGTHSIAVDPGTPGLGQADIGSEPLTVASVASHAGQIAGWSDHLAPGADILFWGCDIGRGAGGQALLADLHTLTGAELAYFQAVTQARFALVSLYLSCGIDLVPPTVDTGDLDVLAQAIAPSVNPWASGLAPDVVLPVPAGKSGS